MKLSIFTTATNPGSRGDNYKDSIDCYQDLADEVLIVNGGYTIQEFNEYDMFKTSQLDSKWPKEFSWEFIGQQFQKGYDACSGDWVLHCDLDFLFHENDFEAIRQALADHSNEPALSFWKYQFILPDRYNLKSRLVIAVNKGVYGDRIRFDSGGDLTQPSLDGKYIDPNTVPEARVAIWNYECLLKTNPQILEDKGRFARAWQKTFGDYKLGGPDDKSAYNEWLKMLKGRFQKPQEFVKLSAHPRYIQETIDNLKPDQWGYSGFGELQVNSYAARS